jgi:hypothetical protein
MAAGAAAVSDRGEGIWRSRRPQAGSLARRDVVGLNFCQSPVQVCLSQQNQLVQGLTDFSLCCKPSIQQATFIA